MSLPFKEEKIESNVYLRTFFQDTDFSEYKWHKDKEDRIIEVLSGSNWGYQLDNQLPMRLEGKVFIPKGVWHRVIKGTDDLHIKLTKLN